MDEMDINPWMEQCFSMQPIESLESLESVHALASMQEEMPAAQHRRWGWSVSAISGACTASAARRPPPP